MSHRRRFFLLSDAGGSSTMTAVKGFVVLAIVLLVPTMGYFQKQIFESRLQPRLYRAAMNVLVEAGVESPVVRMMLLDAEIEGWVASDQEREDVAARVDRLPGIRVKAEDNRLKTYAWIDVERTGGVFDAKGVIPRDVPLDLAPSSEVPTGWDDDVERRFHVKIPEGAAKWAEFLRYYFRQQGDRRVAIRKNAVRLEGDATAGLRSDWLSKASSVVGKDAVSDTLTLRPSVYHFPGYEPESVLDESAGKEVRSALRKVAINFANGETALSPEAKEQTGVAAAAILAAGEGGRYVVGGHPGETGNATENGERALARAEAVRAALVEEGVPAAQLEAVAFGATNGNRRADTVEIVVK